MAEEGAKDVETKPSILLRDKVRGFVDRDIKGNFMTIDLKLMKFLSLKFGSPTFTIFNLVLNEMRKAKGGWNYGKDTESHPVIAVPDAAYGFVAYTTLGLLERETGISNWELRKAFSSLEEGDILACVSPTKGGRSKKATNRPGYAFTETFFSIIENVPDDSKKGDKDAEDNLQEDEMRQEDIRSARAKIEAIRSANKDRDYFKELEEKNVKREYASITAYKTAFVSEMRKKNKNYSLPTSGKNYSTLNSALKSIIDNSKVDKNELLDILRYIVYGDHGTEPEDLNLVFFLKADSFLKTQKEAARWKRGEKKVLKRKTQEKEYEIPEEGLM